MSVVDNVLGSVDSVFDTIGSYAIDHHDGVISLFLLLGVVIAFAGRTILKPTVFLMGFIPIFGIITAFGIALVVDKDTRVNPTYVPILEGLIVIFGLILGVLVGLVMVRMLKGVATFLICAVYGAVLIAIVHLLVYHRASTQNGRIIWYAFMVIAALVTALLSVKYPNASIIIGTSLDGAAIAMFSVGHFLGHGPMLFLTSSLDSAPPQQPPATPVDDRWWAASYSLAILFLALFGAFIQRRVAAAEQYESKHNSRENDQYRFAVLPETTGQRGLSRSSSDHQGVGDQLSSTASQYRVPRYLLPSNDEHQQLITVIEPPRSPSQRRSNDQSPVPANSYGSADSADVQYSVVQNLGAEPLPSSAQSYKDPEK